MNGYRERADATTNAGTQVTVQLSQVQPERRRRVLHCSLHNGTGESVTAQLGIQDGSDFFPIQAKQTVADGDSTAVIAPVMIFAPQAIAAQVKGTANKALVTLYAEGVEGDDPEE